MGAGLVGAGVCVPRQSEVAGRAELSRNGWNVDYIAVCVANLVGEVRYLRTRPRDNRGQSPAKVLFDILRQVIQLSNGEGEGSIALQQGEGNRPQIWHNFLSMSFDTEIFEHGVTL